MPCYQHQRPPPTDLVEEDHADVEELAGGAEGEAVVEAAPGVVLEPRHGAKQHHLGGGARNKTSVPPELISLSP